MPDFIPCYPSPVTEREAVETSPLVLAFIGDAVQTLYERTLAALLLGQKPHELHRAVSRVVSATAQSEAWKRVADSLTDDETAVYKRARNSKSGTSAKNASIVDYRVATGFEAVVGYLYLTGKHARLETVLKRAYGRDVAEADTESQSLDTLIK